MNTRIKAKAVLILLVIPFIKGCSKKVDIVYILDGSSTVSPTDFMHQKSFVASQSKWFTVSPSAVNLGAILRGLNDTKTVGLEPNETADDFNSLVLMLRQPGGIINNFLALHDLRKVFMLSGRESARKYGILITQGKSKKLWFTFNESKLLRMSGVNMIAIGVGSSVSLSELNGVTSNRNSILRVQNFADLASLSEDLYNTICPERSEKIETNPNDSNTTAVLSIPVNDGVKIDTYRESQNESSSHKTSVPSVRDIQVQYNSTINSPSLFKFDLQENGTSIKVEHSTTTWLMNYTFPVVSKRNKLGHTKTTDPNLLKSPGNEPGLQAQGIVVVQRHRPNYLPELLAVPASSTEEYKSVNETRTTTAIPHKNTVEKSDRLPFSALIPHNPDAVPILRLSGNKKNNKLAPLKLFSLDAFNADDKHTDIEDTPSEIAPFLIDPQEGEITRGVESKVFNYSNNSNDDDEVVNKSVVSKLVPPTVSTINERNISPKVEYTIRRHNNEKKQQEKPPMILQQASNVSELISQKPEKPKQKIMKPKMENTSVSRRQIRKDDNHKMKGHSKFSKTNRKLKHLDKIFNHRQDGLHYERVIPGMRPYETPVIDLLHKLAYAQIQSHNPVFSTPKNIFQLDAIPNESGWMHKRPVQIDNAGYYRRKMITVLPVTSQRTDDLRKEKKICTSGPAKDNGYYLEKVGSKYEIRPCPDGTTYDKISCGCTILNLVKDVPICRPELVLDFNGTFIDSSGKRAAVGTTNVNISSGSALFSGDGEITVWRFVGSAVGDSLKIKIKFKPGNSKEARQLLVGNCADGIPMSFGIEIDTLKATVYFIVDTTPRERREIKVSMKPDEWNEATLEYNGLTLTGVVNGNSEKTFLSGDVETRSNPLFIGRCNPSKAGFTGEISEVSLYFCLPQEKGYERR